jgi:hypothetical protein
MISPFQAHASVIGRREHDCGRDILDIGAALAKASEFLVDDDLGAPVGHPADVGREATLGVMRAVDHWQTEHGDRERWICCQNAFDLQIVDLHFGCEVWRRTGPRLRLLRQRHRLGWFRGLGTVENREGSIDILARGYNGPLNDAAKVSDAVAGFVDVGNEVDDDLRPSLDETRQVARERGEVAMDVLGACRVRMLVFASM